MLSTEGPGTFYYYPDRSHWATSIPRNCSKAVLTDGTLPASQLQTLGGRGFAHLFTTLPPGFPGEEFGGSGVEHGLEGVASGLGFPPILELFRCVQPLRA